jgi:ABC-2 type transport system ATP-binding protein
MNPVIETRHLTKLYPASRGSLRDIVMRRKNNGGSKVALDNLNLTVQEGEIFGYLGPNGAGKTTTIRLLLDLIRPTRGNARLFGQDARAQSIEIHRRIGFLPGELALWKNLTGQQVVDYVGSVRGTLDMTYVRQLSERFEFDPSVKVRSYSSGNRRKLGLIIALMHKPDLLILDEPTNGLDPLVQQTFHQMMQEIRDEGRTVFMSSHVLSEVQAICDRVGILRNGQLKAVERVDALTHTEFRWVTVQFRQPVVAARFAGVSGVSDVTVKDKSLHLRLTGDFDPLLRAISEHYIVDLSIQEPTLEEIFLAYYGGSHSENVPNGLVKEVVK